MLVVDRDWRAIHAARCVVEVDLLVPPRFACVPLSFLTSEPSLSQKRNLALCSSIHLHDTTDDVYTGTPSSAALMSVRFVCRIFDGRL
jgi:hypothetical protein